MNQSVILILHEQKAGEFVVVINSKGENLRIDNEKSFSDSGGKLYAAILKGVIRWDNSHFSRECKYNLYSLIVKQKETSVNHTALLI